MLLVLDVGNSNVVMGLFDGQTLKHQWRMHSSRETTADEYGLKMVSLFLLSGVSPDDVEDVIISSVVPPLTPILNRVARTYFHARPLVVGPGTRTGMSIQVDNPREVGADRIVNAVAAYDKYGGPLIVIDFGTATTFCTVSADGIYGGGAIAPGIGISAEALYQAAAKLPRIEIKNPGPVLARNTITAMQSGILYGYVGLVEGLVTRMRQMMPEQTRVVATGGFAEVLAQETDCIDYVEPTLTLDGLRMIYEKNRG